MKPLPIPEQEQLKAFASGLKEVYRLLSEYLGDLNYAPDFRKFITISRNQLAEYLKLHPELIYPHISGSVKQKLHEFPVLEKMKDGKYRVYEIDHGKPWNVQEFTELTHAAATYLMWGW